MSNLSSFLGGGRTPSSIVNEYSSGGASALNGALTAGRTILSGALTANTLATALSITGSGIISFMAVATMDAASKTVRARLTLDGVVVFDATSNTIVNTSNGIIVIGASIYTAATPSGVALRAIPFNASCLLQIASSLTETDKIAAKVIYEVN